MTSFSVTRKKTPFQKHREEEEAKKRRADEEAAKLYEEFVESFKSDDVPGGKAFVRGGLIDPNARPNPSTEGAGSKEGASGSKKPGSRYVPSFMPPGLAAFVNKGKDSEKEKEEEKPKERERPKSRNIDHFMEELKIEQEMREKRIQEGEQSNRDGRKKGISRPLSRFDELPEELDPGKFPGSFDESDPQTTNLYVGNLSPQVDENFLLRTFGRFGPIASVKIMWPRTEEERRRQRNCGFVAFMNRHEAQAAFDEMQGVVVYEYDLRIGWGKAVPLPAQALPAPPPGQMAVRAKEGIKANVAWSGPGAPTSLVSSQTSEVVVTPNIPDIEVVPPEDKHLQHVIDTMALYVLDDGCAFEQAIMERGRGNFMFDFLFDLGSKEHTYYVWRLYSFAQGDTLQRWRTEPFIMITGSGRWVPPPFPVQAFSKSPEREKTFGTTYAAGGGRRVEQERALTDAQRDEFEDMLRALTLERSLIKEAMGFALDNADAAGEVVEVLTESLTLKETPIPTKVARLMLVSDILHNSSAPVKNASAYRTKLEASLPDIMESFNALYRNISGRITAEALKERVMKVLQVWSDWFLFSDAYVNGLKATFLRPGNSGVPEFHSLWGDAPPVKDVSMEEKGLGIGTSTEPEQDYALAMGKGAAARELSNLPLAELERRCKHNGLSTRGGIEVMVSRLLSLEEAEKQRNQQEDDFRSGPKSADIGKAGASGDGGTLGARGDSTWRSGENLPALNGRWQQERNGDESLRKGNRGEALQFRHNARHESAELGTALTGYKSDGIETRSVVLQDADTVLIKDSTESFTSETISPGLEIKSSANISGKLNLPPSKWSREDDGCDDERAERNDVGLSYSSSGSEGVSNSSGKGHRQGTSVESTAVARSDPGMDEERRQKLRRLELAIMEYRESLEDCGIRNKEDIEKKVFLHRKRLEFEYGLAEEYVKGDIDVERDSSRTQDRSRRDQREEKRNSSHSKKRSRSKSGSRSPSFTKDRSNRVREREEERDSAKDKERDRHGDARESIFESEVESDREKERYSRDNERDRDKGRERGKDKEREKEKEREKRNRRS